MAKTLKTLTIFKESNFQDAVAYAEDDQQVFMEEDLSEFIEDDEISFEEVFSDHDLGSLDVAPSEDVTLEEALEGVGEITELAEEAEELAEEVEKLIPGSSASSSSLDEEVEEKETNYIDDGDLTKFMEFITSQYPAKIPQHDGRSMVGCEKALSFLDKLNSRISAAIREDSDDVLDVQKLEEIRVSIMSDILILKNHLSKLKKKFKEEHDKKASTKESAIPTWTDKSGRDVSYDDLKKEASTPNNVVIAVSPFERAISGIMINAHVSGGHPMEDVYEFLSNKYSINEREELAIMQLCMDSGFHIFKDRGSYSSEPSDDGKKTGIDFVRNYFA